VSLRVRRPSAAEVERLLAVASRAEPTYPEVGATRGGRLPSGYRHDRYERGLGRGEEVCEGAAAAVRAWQAQVGAGVEIFPQGARAGDEDTVGLLVRVLGLWATLPCRVLYVEEDPDRFAFAFGTLPGHPEVNGGNVLYMVGINGQHRPVLPHTANADDPAWQPLGG
jgi:uncharacterized protein (UPF0548 family)